MITDSHITPSGGRQLIWRPYQVDQLHTLVCAQLAGKSTLLASCVSSGKTPVMLALASILLYKNIVSHVVFLVPQNCVQIQTICTTNKYDLFDYDGCPYPMAKAIGYDIRNSSTTRQQLSRYLEGDNCEKQIMVVTYDAFRTQGQDIFDKHIRPHLERLGSKLLVSIDEAQHVHEVDQVSQRISGAVNVAGKFHNRLALCSGTAYRNDGLVVPGDVIVSRPLVQNMIDGYSPSTLQYDIEYVSGNASYNESYAGVSNNIAGIVTAVVARWISEGRPYCIVRAIPSNTDVNELLQVELWRAFVAAGATYINASGDTSPDFDALIEYENSDNAQDPSKIAQVIFTFQRGIEGANSPSRSHLFLIGCPRSMALLEQLIGRLMRLKNSLIWYPKTWKTQAKVIFVLPKKDTSAQIAQALLKVGCFFSRLDIAGVFSLPPGLGHGLIGGRTDKEVKLLEPKLHDKIFKLDIASNDFWNKTKHVLDKPRTLQDKVNLVWMTAKEEDLNISKQDIKQYFAQKKENQIRLAHHLLKFYEQGYNRNEAFERAIAALINEFSEIQCDENGQWDTTGYDIALWAYRVLEKLKRKVPTTKQQIKESVEEYLSVEGVFPAMCKKDPRADLTFGHYHTLMSSDRIGNQPNPLYHPGGLRQFIVDEFSNATHWTEAFKQIMVNKAKSHGVIHSANIVQKEDPRRFPEYVYFHDAGIFFEKFPEQAKNLTIAEADYQGRNHT